MFYLKTKQNKKKNKKINNSIKICIHYIRFLGKKQSKQNMYI